MEGCSRLRCRSRLGETDETLETCRGCCFSVEKITKEEQVGPESEPTDVAEEEIDAVETEF